MKIRRRVWKGSDVNDKISCWPREPGEDAKDNDEIRTSFQNIGVVRTPRV
ncbi:hypothetical protein LFML04_0436 [Leptospirillum ferriphilum ML-04]|uniref:Uncharacterized protein n=1 Tax=Leptospirillum ferriphilum (strain ML-04) TaxID=1048260 RepID=J9Z832_LEPFM|nr:hypothetical protein LFML04_0436 [Leptospirillum ferriphilum ML-04]